MSTSCSKTPAATPIEETFMTLVDEYLAAYPLTTPHSISPNGLRICVGKLLIRQRMSKMPDKGQSLPWPGEGAAQTAAIMLVIFVHECLEKSCRTVLGVGSHEFFEVLASVVRDGGVTIEDLMIELIRHDVDGVATQLASSSGFAKLWTATDAAALQAVYEVPDDAGEWSDDTLLPENASDAPLLAGFDSRTTALARRKLFLRTLRIRMACIAFVTIWFASAERLCVTREAVYIFSSGATCMLWPTELASHRRFTLPLSAVTSLCVWIGVLISYFYSSTSHVNTACTVVHALVCLVTASAWSLGAVLSYRYAYTWAAGRAIMIVDGAAFFTSALALRLLGPPPAYPPGNVSFHLALIRAAIIMTWGTLLSPPNRLRIAKLGQAIGFHHVTLHLGEMTGLGAEGEHAGEDESGDGAQGAADASEDVSFDSNSKSHPD